MKTLGQIAYEGAHPTDYSFDMEGARIRMQWESAAQAVRAAVIEECAEIIDDLQLDPHVTNPCMEAIRSLK
jgi:hypothetical protein